jgi:DNA-binding CsgD family transcriptional regulator
MLRGTGALSSGVAASTRVSTSAVVRVIRLVHEGGEIHDRREQQAHLLAGICGIVGGDVAVSFDFDQRVSPRPTAGFVHGFSADEQRTMFDAYMREGDGFDLMAARLRAEFARAATSRERSPIVTCARGELVADREWYRSSYVADFRRAWGIDACVYSFHHAGTMASGMSVNRGFGAAPLTEEERDLVQIFHLESGFLAASRESEPPRADPALEARRAALAPRARDVLDALLTGAADKEIAVRLQISPHTVRQYVKAVYRELGVSSRGELCALWLGQR